MKNALLSLFLVIPVFLFAQFEKNNEASALLLGMEYGLQKPGADLSKRFGSSNGIGGKLEYLFKNNLSVNINGTFYYGRFVKEDPINALRDGDSLFIGNNFSQADVLLRQRGFYMGASVGKLFPVIKNNKRSGIKVDIGIGLFQHKIRIQDDAESFVPIVGGDYKKGFDRLTNGLALHQFIGYQHLAKNRLINCYIGIEFTEAFTQNRRSYNFDTMSVDETKRLDVLTGIKVGWILPFYIGEKGEEVYY